MQTRIASALLLTAMTSPRAAVATPPPRSRHAEHGRSSGGVGSRTHGRSAPAARPLKPLVASVHGDSLKSLGLNPADLPTMDKLTPEQLRKVMGLFTKSLGVDCKFCHKGGDFKAPTEHKKVAERMWNEWVHGVGLKTGATETPMFCDSCHQGQAEFLDKSNHEALAGWMKAEFVGRMHMAKGEVSCETCHGKPFDGEFLEKWEKL